MCVLNLCVWLQTVRVNRDCRWPSALVECRFDACRWCEHAARCSERTSVCLSHGTTMPRPLRVGPMRSFLRSLHRVLPALPTCAIAGNHGWRCSSFGSRFRVTHVSCTCSLISHLTPSLKYRLHCALHLKTHANGLAIALTAYPLARAKASRSSRAVDIFAVKLV